MEKLFILFFLLLFIAVVQRISNEKAKKRHAVKNPDYQIFDLAPPEVADPATAPAVVAEQPKVLPVIDPVPVRKLISLPDPLDYSSYEIPTFMRKACF